MSSGSNTMTAAIRSSASVSTRLKDIARNAELRAARQFGTSENKAFAAGRNDLRRDIRHRRSRRPPAGLRSRHPDRVGSRRSRPAGDRRCNSRRPESEPSRPSRAPRSTPGSVRCTGLPVSSPAPRMQLVEPRERGVEVCLVEDLGAVDQVAVDRENADIRHSASKPSGEVPMRTWVTTAPKLLSRCTAST